MINKVDLAYTRMLLELMIECRKNGDCAGCKYFEICGEEDIPAQTAYWFAKLIKEVETLKNSDLNKD